MGLHNAIETELQQMKKEEKVIRLTVIKEDDCYKAFTDLKLEGEYIVNAEGIENQIVQIEQNGKQISIYGLNSDESKINVFFSKNSASLLVALKNKLKMDKIITDPFFIVGPPGTGKTKVITKIVEEQLKNGKKVLITSPTNMAIENVFEKIDFEALNLQDGEVILSIKTENENLLDYSDNAILKRKLDLINDEIEIIEMAKEELLGRKRDIEPILYSLEKDAESRAIRLKNLEKDISEAKAYLKSLRAKTKTLKLKKQSLQSNAFIRSIAHLFLSEKLEKIDEEIKELEVNIKEVMGKIVKLEDKKCNLVSFDIQELKNKKEELNEINSSIHKVQKELKKLEEKKNSLNKTSIWEGVRLVGSTLMGAALRHNIQYIDFDVVIIDEASMAIYPLLVAATQMLKINEKYNISYIEDKQLTDTQNEAVGKALQKQLIVVGDPKQLSPIAKTKELKQSIFDVFNVEEIFNGELRDDAVFLDKNYRNHSEITKLISDMFYGEKLESAKKTTQEKALFIKKSPSKMIPSGSSYINPGNIYLIKEQVQIALKRGRRSIGIITPYAKQAELINKEFAEIKREYPDADLQAGTVHKFQGKEKEIIIFDITFSPYSKDSELPAAYSGGKNSETSRLLNVATTRAEDFFVLIGDVDGILNMKKESILKEWVGEISKIK